MMFILHSEQSEETTGFTMMYIFISYSERSEGARDLTMMVIYFSFFSLLRLFLSEGVL